MHDVDSPGGAEPAAAMTPVTKKVLVVDDHPQIRRLIQINLEKSTLRIIEAADGEEGMERVRAERPDLIILDVMMPRRNGFEMLRDLKTDPELQAIPVIMLTIRSHTPDIAHGLREGAEFYLPKPFHPDELSELVRRVLDEG
jgi:two-component system, OmpR family, alkaline phosphatase synthesis response regulator PhoP